MVFTRKCDLISPVGAGVLIALPEREESGVSQIFACVSVQQLDDDVDVERHVLGCRLTY